MVSDLIEIFENLGVQVRHVKTILPMNFVIGCEKEIHATIEYAEDDNSVQSLLVMILHISNILLQYLRNCGKIV